MKLASVLLLLSLYQGGYARSVPAVPEPLGSLPLAKDSGGGAVPRGLGDMVSGLFGGSAPTTKAPPTTPAPNSGGFFGNLGGWLGRTTTTTPPPPTTPPPTSLLGRLTGFFSGLLGRRSRSLEPSGGVFDDALHVLAARFLDGLRGKEAAAGTLLGLTSGLFLGDQDGGMSFGNVAYSLLNSPAGTDLLGSMGHAVGSSVASGVLGVLTDGTGSLLSSFFGGEPDRGELPPLSGLLGQAVKLGGDAMKMKMTAEAGLVNTGLGAADASVQVGTNLIKDAVAMGTDVGKQALGGLTSVAGTALKDGTNLAKESFGLLSKVPLLGNLVEPVAGKVGAVLDTVSEGGSAALGSGKVLGAAALEAADTGASLGADLAAGTSKLGFATGKTAVSSGTNFVNGMLDKVVGLVHKRG